MNDYHSTADGGQPDVTWLIDQLVREVPTITAVVLVSADGLQLASSGHLSREHAESVAALAAGFLGITGQLGGLLQLGAPENLSIRYPHGHLAFLRIDDPTGDFVAALLVAAQPQTQIGHLGYAMTTFSQSVGHALTPETRHALHQNTLPAPARR
ncbi:roadblock/LC7 domain-containing protein [Actinoplanes sichuanensis]|uniref:Roadblock/LC7 domain-containing protein n=1 Tax=Actinoplanes sichuanensis TaxID=512349 RepID=A0ABW4APJ6_9ACTN|nr:roadblock/LC7 domain-containing protein [Actinoplanes sichuanensis]BEL06800.1 roadblock/LC7 domain-containing protein [Actinoplanes sichuanensis]